MSKALENAVKGHLLCVERKVVLDMNIQKLMADGLVGWSGSWKVQDWRIGEKEEACE